MFPDTSGVPGASGNLRLRLKETLPVPNSTTQSTLFGHPKGLYVLFFTEMWERFNYYGMRALLILYMVNYFKWPQDQASKTYKWFTGLVYLTPLIGGFLADKYLGNKWAIILGATTMALGQFCMSVQSEQVFYISLGLLVIGNGLFKPNMATQVGRLYPPNDPRRDSAYTIFYMGINLGAFMAPLICSELRDRIGYHAGFMAAGVGMLVGLVTYLLFIKWVQEAPSMSTAPVATSSGREPLSTKRYIGEEEANRSPSVVPRLSAGAPTLMLFLGLASPAIALALWLLGSIKANDAVAYGAGLGIACIMGAMVLRHIHGAARDRVLTIYILGLFVVFFWGAFEQAGNAMNIFADKTTERYLTEVPPTPSVYPEVSRSATETVTQTGGWIRNLQSRLATGVNPLSPGWFQSIRPYVAVVFLAVLLWVWMYLRSSVSLIGKLGISLFLLLVALALVAWAPTRETLRQAFNPVKTEWFQSINALAIFILAPVFAWLWVFLPRIGVRLSIAAKMALGIFLQGMAFALMIWSVRYENQPSSVPVAALPAGVSSDAVGRLIFRDAPDLADEKWSQKIESREVDPDHAAVINGGRISFDGTRKQLLMTGVLADTDRDRVLRATVPPAYLAKVRELALESQKAKKDRGEPFVVSVALDRTPPGFDLRYTGFNAGQIRYEEASRTLTATIALADRDYKGLLVSGADSQFRESMNRLYVESAKFKVSSQWLLWFYVLCTLGELCLSPVGLSMVSKLAPKAYGTMLMGTWHVMIFFGNYSAGLLGESYGTLHPVEYFAYITVSLLAVSFLCFLLVRKIKSMMHGVN